LGKSHTPLAEPAERQEGAGLQLRRAREAGRISVASAAASLHLPPRVIVALEESDFGQFEPVYVRGYLRNYARLLDLAAEPLIESYNQTLALDQPPPAQPQQPPSRHDGKPPQRLYLLLAVVAVPLVLWGAGKALLAVWEAGKPQDTDSAPPRVSRQEGQPAIALPGQTASLPAAEAGGQAPSPSASQPPAPPPTEAATAAALNDPPKPEPAHNPQPAASATPAPTPTPAPAPASAPTAPGPAIGQGPDSIALRLSASAWVSVRDQTGRRLVYENLPAGTERTYSGQAPFAVVLGNSPATKVEFNGQPYEPPKAKAGTVARFTLGKPSLENPAKPGGR